MYIKRPFLLTVLCSAQLFTAAIQAYDHSKALVDAAAKTLTLDRLDKYAGIVKAGGADLSISNEQALCHLEILRNIVAQNSGSSEQINQALPCSAHDLNQEQCHMIIASLALRVKEMIFLTLLDGFLNPANTQSLREHVNQFATFMKRADGSYEQGYAAVVEAMISIKDVDTVARGKEVKDKIMSAIPTLPAHIQKLAGELIKKRSDQELISALNSRIKLNKKK